MIIINIIVYYYINIELHPIKKYVCFFYTHTYMYAHTIEDV